MHFPSLALLFLPFQNCIFLKPIRSDRIKGMNLFQMFQHLQIEFIPLSQYLNLISALIIIDALGCLYPEMAIFYLFFYKTKNLPMVLHRVEQHIKPLKVKGLHNSYNRESN